MPPVPSAWRLAWLLFMQPITLHRMYPAWGFNDDPSVIQLWRQVRAGHPVARTLLARYAVLLLVGTPATTALVAGRWPCRACPSDGPAWRSAWRAA
jgi:hypothetical protein